MPQIILVALIVTLAFAAAIWKLMPARRRWQALSVLDARAARHPALAGLRSRWIAPRLARAAGAGCAGCAANITARKSPPPRP